MERFRVAIPVEVTLDTESHRFFTRRSQEILFTLDSMLLFGLCIIEYDSLTLHSYHTISYHTIPYITLLHDIALHWIALRTQFWICLCFACSLVIRRDLLFEIEQSQKTSKRFAVKKA